MTKACILDDAYAVSHMRQAQDAAQEDYLSMGMRQHLKNVLKMCNFLCFTQSQNALGKISN